MSVQAGALGVLLGLLGLQPGPEVEAPAVPDVLSPAADAVQLLWDAPPGCPEAPAVRRALAGYLGPEPAQEVGAGVRVTAQVTEGEGGYRLALRTETASGVTTRETTAEECGVLVDATALIVAIAVDPSSVVGRAAAEASPEPPPAEPPDPAATGLGPEGGIRLLTPVVQALGAMHAAGLVHRDLKPENVIVSPRGEVTLVDLGLALGLGQSRLTQA
ncbi:MAG: hypothetical protein KDK70_27640, partial [Myxococcales bacterium]|nr:hypothetical protein [Myxococcales bacterium]